MYKLKNVKIQGFWGDCIIDTTFFNDFTFFHGENGTGKTTFISILQDVLEFDLEAISFHQFVKIELILNNGSKTRKISLEKISDNDIEYTEIHVKIGRSKYVLPVINYSREIRTGRFNFKISQQIEEIKETFASLFNLSFLSVSRVKRKRYNDEKSVINRLPIDRKLTNRLPIDRKLNELMGDLTAYQLNLENVVNTHSLQFQKNVLKSMLFDNELDFVDLNQEIHIDLDSIKSGLISVYKDLKVLDSETKKTINTHIEAISTAAKAINEHVIDKEKPVFANHVTPITLLKRTHRIIELLNQFNTQKDKILEPVNNYTDLLHNFIKGKTFEISNEKRGGLIVKKEKVSFPYHRLSSGEKQLIILLTETLLQREEPYIFIADEPEISLHIKWQRMLATAISEINPNAQLIFATHSPEIVGKRRTNLVNMSNIINNG